MVLLLDVDFSPSAGLHQRLTASAPALLTDLSRYRHAIVLPAFETGPELSIEEGHAATAAAVSGACLQPADAAAAHCQSSIASSDL